MGRRRITFQLYEQGGAGAMRGEGIFASGGAVYVAKDGDAQKQAITDKDGAALSNPRALTQGSCEFYVPDTISLVDLYIQSPGGQFLVVYDVDESLADIAIDVTTRRQTMVIPFSIVDTTANVETDTAFDLPALCMVLNRLHGCGIRVTTLDATEDISVGLGEVTPAESGGDADGFIAASDLDNAAMVIGTDGALFSTNAPHRADAVTAKSITYTLTAGTDTAEGFIHLPLVLYA